MNSFGENVKKLRKAKGISQKVLARDLEISQGTIANYEKDNRFPKEKILLKLADYFEVSVDHLIGRDLSHENEDEDDLKTIKYLDFSIIDESFYKFASKYYYDLIKENDIESAYLLVYQIYLSGGEIIDIYNKIFTASLRRVGNLWSLGKLDVASEHHFTALSENVMTRLHLKVKKKTSSDKKVLCMCVKNEKHVIACKMLGNFVEYLGLNNYYIGENVPHDSLEIYVAKNKIDMVLISITMDENEGELDNLLSFIANSKVLNKVEIIVGGQFFKSLLMLEKYKNYRTVLSIEELLDILSKYKAEEMEK
ncbi:MAG: helix-turn-helix domain-containing protein [Acidaminobacteraceae bacterium]